MGYYSLATGSVTHAEIGRSLLHNMPNPVVLLGRLAVDVCSQGDGFGKWLLNDAIHRVVSLADQVGIKAVMVHAIDDDARAFYERFGFVRSVVALNTLFYKV